MASIDDIRKKYPQYSDISDEKLLDGFHKKFYSDMDKDVFLEKVGYKAEGEFSKGLDRSWEETKAIFTEGIPALAQSASNKALGTDFDVQENVDAYKAKVDKANKENPAKIPSYTDIRKDNLDTVEGWKNLASDSGDYIAGGLGEVLPSAAISMISSGVGGTIAKSLVKKGVQEVTEAQITKAIAKGILISNGISSMAQEAPSTYLQEALKGNDAPFTALTAGAIKAAIEKFPEYGLWKKILGPGAGDALTSSFLKKVGVPDFANKVVTQGIKAAPKEGVEEVAQTSVDILAGALVSDSPIFTAENFDSLVDSGLKGMIGGAAMGAGAAPLMTDKADEGYQKNPKNDKRFELEDAGSAPKGIKISDKAMDSSVLEPLTMKPEELEKLKSYGIKGEDLIGYDPQQTATINQVLENPIGDITPLPPKQVEAIKGRRKAIKDNKRTDRAFMPGDGEVVYGARSDFKMPIVDPITEIRVWDYKAAEQKAGDVVQPPVQAEARDVPKDDPMYQRRSNTPKFLNMYSKMEREIEKSFPNKATPEEFLSLMQKGAAAGKYKQDEVNYSGISTYLNDFIKGNRKGLAVDKDGKVTKKDMLDAAKGFLSGYFDGANDPNTLPVQARDLDGQYQDTTLEKENSKNYRVRVLNFPTGENPSTRTHWGSVPNVVVHHRSSDITADDGTNLKLVQEVQGDVQQRIEKERGQIVYDIAQSYLTEYANNLENDIKNRLGTSWRSNKDALDETTKARDEAQSFYTKYNDNFMTDAQKEALKKAALDVPKNYGYYDPNATSEIAELNSLVKETQARLQDFKTRAEDIKKRHGDISTISKRKDAVQRETVNGREDFNFFKGVVKVRAWYEQGVDDLRLKARQDVNKALENVKVENSAWNKTLLADAKMIETNLAAFVEWVTLDKQYELVQQINRPVSNNITSLTNRVYELGKQIDKLKTKGPDIPFKNDYPLLALKDAIQIAVEEGQTAIAIPTGPMVKDIQGHSDEKAGPFYEKRVLNNLKELAKFLKSDVVEKEYTPGGKKDHKNAEVVKQRAAFITKVNDAINGDPVANTGWGGWGKAKAKAAEIIAKWEARGDGEHDVTQPLMAVYKDGHENDADIVFAVISFDKMQEMAKDEPVLVQTMLGDAAQIISQDTWSSYYINTMNQYVDYLQDNPNTSYKINVLQLSPEGVRIVKEEGLPMMQRGAAINLPVTGQLDTDYALPVQIAKNWFGTQLSPKAREQHKALIDMIKRVAKETLGPNINFKFMESMFVQEEFHTNPVDGTWWNNTLYLALPENATELTVLEPLYHEFWHGLERLKAFTKGEVQYMDSNTKLLRYYYDKDGYLSEFEFNDLMNDKMMREELRANAFGKAMVEFLKDEASLQKVPAPFRGVFRKAMNFLKRLRMGLNAQDFNKFSDILTKALEGGYATPQQMRDTLFDSVDKTAQMRFQKKAKSKRKAHREKNENEMDMKLARSIKASNEMTATKGSTMGFFAEKLASIAHLASKYPIAAQVFLAVRQKYEMSNQLLNKYAKAMGNFGSLNKDIRWRLSELADEMRRTDQKATLDKDGKLTFQRDGRMMKLKDKEISKAYIDLQRGFEMALNDHVASVMARLTKQAFGEANEAVTLTELENRKAAADPKKDKAVLDLIEEMIDIQKSAENMLKSDYFPAMRFGNFGITVINVKGLSPDEVARVKKGETKLGKQAAFYTVEEGSFNKLYNKNQMEDISRELKANYDSSDYVVLGDRHISNFDVEHLSPFTMTHALEKRLLDPRFFNLELLSSLLQNEGLSPKAKEALTDKLYGEISTKGFSKRFDKSRHVPGYSKDYDRAVHAYFSGASHYLAGLNSAEKFSALSRVVQGLSDRKLQKRLEEFLKYNNTAAEDMATLRTVNFLWTMGGNLSTALLQAVTLPTFTLSNLSKYNPSVIENMKTISKWTAIGIKLVSRGSMFNPSGHVFGTPDQIQQARIDGIINRDEMHFLLKNYETGSMKAMSTEEQIGYKNYDVRGMAGGAKQTLANTANLLGKPIAFMEQITRFATLMAAYETARKPGVMDRANRVLKNDERFKGMVEEFTDMDPMENLALYIMDEAHGIFGKVGRPELLKGFMGAVPLAFMTYPYQMIEGLVRSFGQGADGRRALAITMGAMFLLGGLMGLPGAELLKEVLEALETKYTGVERDYKLALMETIAEKTGSVAFAKFLVGGFPRAFVGVDTALRTGLPIPGQEILFTLLGIRKDASQLLGVQGSIMAGIGDAMLQYNSDAPVATVAGAMMPTAFANVAKAYQYSQEGVRSAKQQLVTKEDTSAGTIAAKALGFTSDQVASGRESVLNEMIQSTRGKTGIDRLRMKGKKAAVAMMQAEEDGDDAAYKENFDKLQPVVEEYVAFCEKNELPIDVPSFIKSITESGVQAITGETMLKNVPKAAKLPVQHWRDLGLSPVKQ